MEETPTVQARVRIPDYEYLKKLSDERHTTIPQILSEMITIYKKAKKE